MLLAEKMGLEGFEYKYLSLFDYVGGGGICTFISTMLMRDKVRERYNIEGSTGGDCCIAFCCTSCAICQMRNQVDETVEWSYAIFYNRINFNVHHFTTDCLVSLNIHCTSFSCKWTLIFFTPFHILQQTSFVYNTWYPFIHNCYLISIYKYMQIKQAWTRIYSCANYEFYNKHHRQDQFLILYLSPPSR